MHPQWLLSANEEQRALARICSELTGTVIDVGCADRRIAKLLRNDCNYIGMDYPGTAIALYRTFPDTFADARCLPLPDASVDAVVLKDVLEHVADPDMAISEASRVLVPGGQLVLWMPFLYPIHDAPHDYQRFTASGLARRLAACGFKVRNIESGPGAIRAAGLLGSLAIADAGEQILTKRRLLLPLLPLLGTLVLAINLVAWALSWLPGSGFMPAFYRVLAVRDGT